MSFFFLTAHERRPVHVPGTEKIEVLRVICEIVLFEISAVCFTFNATADLHLHEFHTGYLERRLRSKMGSSTVLETTH